MTSIIIDRRYCGPPNSGNGGYVCGRLARHIPGGADDFSQHFRFHERAFFHKAITTQHNNIARQQRPAGNRRVSAILEDTDLARGVESATADAFAQRLGDRT